MTTFAQFVVLFLAWLGTASAVKPGEKYDGTVQRTWWDEMKRGNDHGEHLRKCLFETVVPANGATCPNIDHHSDHYFCVFGTEEEPTWFCTCSSTDFKFHCSKTRVVEQEEIADAVVVGPGDKYDGSNQPTWWHEMKESGTYEQLRECIYQETVPNTCDSCPGIAKGSDHYYCFFGSSTRPTWYCTCSEIDFKFRCSADEPIDPNDIETGKCDSGKSTYFHFIAIAIAVLVLAVMTYQFFHRQQGKTKKNKNDITNEAETAKVLAQSHPII